MPIILLALTKAALIFFSIHVAPVAGAAVLFAIV